MSDVTPPPGPGINLRPRDVVPAGMIPELQGIVGDAAFGRERMTLPKWCEACRDNFDVDHYTKDGQRHRVGGQYGPTGERMAYVRELERAAREFLAWTAGMWPDQSRVERARQRLSRVLARGQI